MTYLLAIYGLPIVASGLFGACLAAIGAQIAARDRAMQTLCLSQGAVLGVLLSIGILSTFFDATHPGVIWPFVGAFLGSAVAFFLSETLVSKVESSKNSYFAALFACLLATGYFVTALFPGLEIHMSQKYFGDLAVITDDTASVATLLAVFGGAVLIAVARPLTRATFFHSALGIRGVRAREQLPFLAFTLALIAFSTQAMGLLFTITALFVPTTLLARGAGGYKTHLITCGGVGLLASTFGFFLSLAGPQLPTVPVVCFCMVGLSVLAAFMLRLVR